MHKIVRLPEVIKSTGLARSTIYKKMASQNFPMKFQLGSKSIGWLEADIQSWIQNKITESKIKPK